MTVFALKYLFGDPESYKHVLLSTLGVMLILTSAVLLFKGRLQRTRPQHSPSNSFLVKHRNTLTVLMGVLLGICVTLSSVGAGAFGAAVLLMLYPGLSSMKVIGTDIAHAVPLTMIAGFGHFTLGNVDFYLLGALLMGSLPAIHFGTMVAKKLPERILQSTLASILCAIGIKYAFF